MKNVLCMMAITVFIVILQGCRNSQSNSRDEKDNNSSYTVNKETSTPATITPTPTALQTITPNVTSKPITTPSSKTKPTFAKESLVTFDEGIKALLEEKAKDIVENPKIELIDGYKIVNIATGDLNSDGRSDLAVVVEKLSENQKGSRMLYVLMQNADNSYFVKHANQNIILGRGQGGVFGDPFRKIEIKDNILIVNEYGGSNFRWEFVDQFRYLGNEFMLINSKRSNLFTGTLNGYDQDYDYINNIFKYTSTSQANKDYKPKVIYTDKLSGDRYLFDSFDIDEYQKAIEINFLPSLLSWEYNKEGKMPDLNISSNKALDLVKNAFHDDMEKVQLPWTAETKDNYSSLIFCPVPDYYYKKGDTLLYYYQLDNNAKLEHWIIYKYENSKLTFYKVNDSTGEIKRN